MKKLNKKQRREIYLKAAKFLFNFPDDNICICPSISEVAYGHDYAQTSALLPIFKEFALFQPYPNANRWFNEGDEKGDRLTALLLCAEMCKP